MARHEVAGDDDEVGLQLSHAFERPGEERLVDDGPGVQVAELDEPFADERLGQSREGKRPAHDVDPMRFDAPGVEERAGGDGGGASHGAAQEPTPRDAPRSAVDSAACSWATVDSVECLESLGNDIGIFRGGETRYSGSEDRHYTPAMPRGRR